MSIVEIAREEIRRLKPYVSARSLSSPARVSLDANENPWASAGDPGLGLNRYPDPQPIALLEKLSALYRVPAERLLVTRGSDEAIDLLVRAFCRAGQDAIAQCSPCFGMYAIAARIQGAEVLDVPLEGDGFQLPVRGLCELSDERPRVVFLCSPNNPTGNTMERAGVLAVCRALQGRALVVVDEAYVEFSRGSLVNLLDEVDNLVILRTLSKAWGLAGARCGVLIGATEVAELIRRILPPYPLPTPTVQAVVTALSASGQATMQEQVERLTGLRNQTADRLASMKVVERVWPSEANFLLIRLPDARSFYRFAAERGVLLRDFSGHDALNDCLRVSIGCESDMTALFKVFEQWEAGR